jgi:hypothetical protein
MTYHPQINDYVKWRNVEGWVYFVDKEYITIEVGVKPKPDSLVGFHRKVHCLILCYTHQWHEIKYEKSRRFKNANDLDDMEIYVRDFNGKK